MNVAFIKDIYKKIRPESLFLQFNSRTDPLEKEFTEEYLNRSAIITRYSLILGLLFYSLFGILDALIVPDQKYSLWFIRFAVVDPILAILIILSFFKTFRKYLEMFGVIALIISGSGISVMVAIAEPPANYSYYAGIILVLMLGYGLLRIRFKWASFAGWFNVFIYEVISIFIAETPTEILINNNFFFISANLIGMLSCYAVEYYIRSNFIIARLLNKEKENVKKLNMNLEHMVEERTSELINVNIDLQNEINARNSAENERKDLKQKLSQSQKMESLGNFAGGIAHDFNNILTSILGYTELSLSTVEEDSRLKDYLEMIYSSGERAAELVSQILSFARRSERKIESVRPDLILKEVLRFMRSSIPSTIEIRSSIDCQAYILGNTTQIHQIFMNLFTNAAHAMTEEGGILDISMKEVELLNPESENLISGSGKYIRIDISDTGTGIPPELINSVFEPYFTTKKIGEGTGLGLAVVHGIVESYGGRISVSNNEGKGSHFVIHLPVTDKEITLKENSTDIILEGHERILLLDDEPAIAESGKLILASLGYKVTSMTDSQVALEFFNQNTDEFDLIITDLMMPQMNGVKFSQKVRELQKDIPVILCSGYDKESSLNKMDFNHRTSYLNKPYTKLDLAKEIRRMLDLK